MSQRSISAAVSYIGVDDHISPLFEGQYVIPNGISYNSYVIHDKRIAVLDTSDSCCRDQWMANLESELSGKNPDYLIVSHLEPDHAACIGQIMERYPDMQAVCSARAAQMLKRFFAHDYTPRLEVVGEGDTLCLGSHTLQFIMAPMVHWPEVMLTYEQSEQILFSADAFGKFGALDVDEPWTCEARRYYFNICGKYGAPVQAALRKAAALSVKTICPLHGPVLQDNLDYYLGLYDTWSSYRAESEGVHIAYCSLHGNTEQAALALAEKLRAAGNVTVAVTDLRTADMAEAVEDAFRYDRMVLAAPTYDGGIMPVMADFLHHLASKAYQRRRVALIENGSWAPQAGKKMRQELEAMRDITIVEPLVTVESTVKAATLAKLDELAAALLR